MMCNRILLLIGLFLVSCFFLSVVQVFVLFDFFCMDCLEFDMNCLDGCGMYLVYYINICFGEKLVFDVGEESSWE